MQYEQTFNYLVFNLNYCLKLFSDLLLSRELPGLVTESKADSFITAASQIERGSFSGSKGLFCLGRSAQAKMMNLDVLCNVCDLCLTNFRHTLDHPFQQMYLQSMSCDVTHVSLIYTL